VEACGFELDFLLRPLRRDAAEDARLGKSVVRSPQERVRRMLRGLEG
jgi:hypothetical protein